MIKSTRKLLGILLLATAGVFSCDKGLDENEIAKINELTVTTTHFENAFKEYYYRTGQAIRPSKSTRLTVLNSQFNNYVLATYAKDVGIDETIEAYRKKKEIERRVLNEEYLDQVVLSDIKVSEKELNEYFIRFNTTLRASHLFAHDLESANTLYERLQNGEQFEQLAEEVFQTPYLKNNGGDIGRFTTDEMDIAFEETAFGLNVGEISKPVPTAQGYSIIKLTDRFTKPILTKTEFANAKAQVHQYVYRKKKELATRQHIYEFNSGLEIDESAFESLWSMMNENYSSAISKDVEFIESMKSETKLASYNGYEFSMTNYAEEFSITPLSQINAIEGEKGFESFLKGLAMRAYLFESANQAGIQDQELVQESIDETYLIYLAAEAVDRLRNTIKNSEEELKAVFAENKERFYQPMQVGLSRIVVESKEKANKLIDEYKSGVKFTSLLEKYTLYNEDLMTDGNLGLENLTTYGSFGPEIAKTDIGDLTKPLSYTSKEFIVYLVNEKTEGRYLNFEESKERVDAFLTNQKLRILKEETIEAVKKEHNAQVDIEKLNNITIQI